VGQARAAMATTRDDSVSQNQDSANRWIRAGLPDRFSSFAQCLAHEPLVSIHLEETSYSGAIRLRKSFAFLLGECVAPDLLRE